MQELEQHKTLANLYQDAANEAQRVAEVARKDAMSLESDFEALHNENAFGQKLQNAQVRYVCVYVYAGIVFCKSQYVLCRSLCMYV